MAMQLIDALAVEWEPESFHDSFREKVEALVKAKAAGETTVEKAEPAAEPTGAVDLMEALRASVERARSPKDTGDKAASPGTRAARGQKAPAAKKRARSGPAANGQELMALTKSALYEKAAAAGVGPDRPVVGGPALARSRSGHRDAQDVRLTRTDRLRLFPEVRVRETEQRLIRGPAKQREDLGDGPAATRFGELGEGPLVGSSVRARAVGQQPVKVLPLDADLAHGPLLRSSGAPVRTHVFDATRRV
ncbi:hypothetical protein OG594_44720 [Streptomyces sp. NBC_01214]|nr:hypothetical protein [Streptomyces sp. NBC_01214]MCX4808605.1 hypothetical protein [Streptomyces sp. NBC_01214]